MDRGNSNITVDTSFLARDARFRHEKPYSMRYPPEIDILQSNLIQDAKSVQLEDMRHHIGTLEFEQCGFRVMSLVSSMAYSDFEDEDKVTRIYREEIASTLGESLQATHVHVLDHVVCRPFDLLYIRDSQGVTDTIGHVGSPSSCVFSHLYGQRLGPRTTNELGPYG